MIFAADNSTFINTAFVVAAAVIFGFFTLIRGRSDVWKSNYEAEKARGDEFAKEIVTLKKRVTELEAQPNIEILYKMLVEHEKRAAANNKRVVKALKAITKKLVA